MIVLYGVHQVVVKVVDRCAGCAENYLVLSPTAFQALAGNMTVSLINATWDFQDAI
jgi:hypothetical protein